MEWNLLVGQVSSVFAVITSFQLILMHLWNYHDPKLQLYIIRIILIVPVNVTQVYSIQSCLSILQPERALLYNTVRDCYEAYVLYYFMQLIVAYFGSSDHMLGHIICRGRLKRPWPLDALPTLVLDESFFQNAKFGIIQFALVKPVTALFAILLDGWGVYREGDFSLSAGYVYISLANNVSVSVSLYYLFLIYQACEDHLEPYKPFLKFLCVKGVLFFSFWQSFLFSILVRFGWFGDFDIGQQTAARFQDLMICVEMSLAAVLMHWAFPYRDFVHRHRPHTSVLKRIRDVLDVTDVISDTKSAFAKVETCSYHAHKDLWDDSAQG